MYLALYVDDGLLASRDSGLLAENLKELKTQIDVTGGDCKSFVGLEIEKFHDKINTGQQMYIPKFLDRFGMLDCKPVCVAVSSETHNTKYKTSTCDEVNSTFPYSEAVGCLMFSACVSGPDIMFAVSQASRHLESPSEENVIAVKRILRFLNGSKDVHIS